MADVMYECGWLSLLLSLLFLMFVDKGLMFYYSVYMFGVGQGQT